jgi:hypothetical protein
MKNKIALTAGLILLSGLGLAFAGADVKPAAKAAPEVKQEDAKVKEFKGILFQLVRQDEYLDEAIETLDSSKGRLSAHDISAMGLSLKMIAGNLNRVSTLNKNEFASIQPGSNLSKYTNTILSYSKSVNRKSAQVSATVARLAAANKKSGMRDAVSSKKGSKKGGKKLTQLLEEQKALAALAADAKTLRGASRNLNATSKWLYIASK